MNCLRLLLASGVQRPPAPTVVDDATWSVGQHSPMMHAALISQSVECLELLLDADFGPVDDVGWTSAFVCLIVFGGGVTVVHSVVTHAVASHTAHRSRRQHTA